MKKLLLTCGALFGASVPAFAREMNMDNTQGLFGLKPEYVHTLINPLPTYGLLVGIGILIVGLLIRNISTRNTGLIVILICSGVTWAVIHYGQHGYNHLYMDLDPESKRWADIHMDRAESFAWAFYGTAILSIIALAKRKTSAVKVTTSSTSTSSTAAAAPTPKPTLAATQVTRTLSPVATGLAVAALILAIISFCLGSWISRAGGRIRHTEFREGPAPTNAPAAHEHHD